MPVSDAQHLGAIGVIAPRLAPEVRRLQGRHQKRDMPGLLLLLVNDLFDPPQHLVAQGQPGIDPGARLPDHARAQHEPVADDLRVRRCLFQNGQKVACQAHFLSSGSVLVRLRESRERGKLRWGARLWKHTRLGGPGRDLHRMRPDHLALTPSSDPGRSAAAGPERAARERNHGLIGSNISARTTAFTGDHGTVTTVTRPASRPVNLSTCPRNGP